MTACSPIRGPIGAKLFQKWNIVKTKNVSNIYIYIWNLYCFCFVSDVYIYIYISTWPCEMVSSVKFSRIPEQNSAAVRCRRRHFFFFSFPPSDFFPSDGTRLYTSCRVYTTLYGKRGIYVFRSSFEFQFFPFYYTINVNFTSENIKSPWIRVHDLARGKKLVSNSNAFNHEITITRNTRKQVKSDAESI